jgi:hypothetical protein
MKEMTGNFPVRCRIFNDHRGLDGTALETVRAPILKWTASWKVEQVGRLTR